MGILKLKLLIGLATAGAVVFALSARAEGSKESSPGQAQAVSAGASAQIYLSGSVGSTMLAEFAEIMRDLPFAVKDITVQLNSSGGGVSEGKSIIELLKSQKLIGRRVTTVVANGNNCVSICVPIFMAGDVRKVGPASSFLFHAIHKSILVRFVLPQQVEETRKLLEDSGIRKEFVARLYDQGILASFTGYWMSGRELVEENTGMVTELLPRLDQGVEFNFGGLKIGF